MDYQPDFTVSAAAISMVAEISALIERYIITQEASESLKLRRANKIKTIQSSARVFLCKRSSKAESWSVQSPDLPITARFAVKHSFVNGTVSAQ